MYTFEHSGLFINGFYIHYIDSYRYNKDKIDLSKVIIRIRSLQNPKQHWGN